MDPVSATHIAANALSVAKGAWDIGNALYKFIKDARSIDSTARAFAGETRALAAACNVVSTRLEAIVKERDAELGPNDSGSNQHNPLWACLDSQIIECRETVSQLQVTVECAQQDSTKGTTFLGQATRQFKLDMKSNEIAELRTRIQSHTSSLQLILQAVAM